MEVKRYAALLKRSWWVVALVVLAAMASAYGVSKAMKPVFRATTTLAAGASVGASGNASQYIALTTGGLLNQYARALTTRTLAQQVSDQLKLDIPAEKLQSEIKAVPTNQDLTIRVDVEDHDPTTARLVANKLAELFVAQKQQEANKGAAVLGSQQDTVLVNVLDPAVTPRAPIKPQTRTNVAAAGILGLIVGVLVIFVADWFDDTVRGPGEAESLLDTRILAAIPQLKAGKRSMYAHRPAPVGGAR
ncbi:MAG TPA: Wzz/FepE/Etk N-terminal domain-containing protein [Chloroflexota bacterium]|nr:Wzz/FepE/Etk N-terminal domain-containing protein [Chloroflexota bacterium]